MNIKEVENRTGLERANIYFYEKEGLVTPARLSNGYRDYSEEDLKFLMKIKLLRSLHISLEDIRALKDGDISLHAAMDQQILELEKEEEKATYARMLCENIRDDEISFTRLDAEKYLNGVPRTPRPEENPYFSMPLEVFPQTLFPWKRFFARVCDWLLYKIVVVIIFNLAFGVSIINPKALESWLIFFAELLLWFVVEPCCLHFFGTTPGKALWGLTIKNTNGKNLSFRDSWRRTCWVFLRGLGLHIPIYRCYRLYQCYQRCTDHRLQDWEVDIPIQYTSKEGLGRNRLDRCRRILGNRKLIFTITTLVLSVFFIFLLWPRPISDLVPDSVTNITITTSRNIYTPSPYEDRPGTVQLEWKIYEFDSEEEIELVMKAFKKHKFHYTLKEYTNKFLSVVFRADYKFRYHGDQTLPADISIDISDGSFPSTILTSHGTKYLLRNNEGLFYQIGYFGDSKGFEFFEDIIRLLSDEYKIHDLIKPF